MGVLITIAVTAGLAYLALDVDVRTAVLLGAVVASTDAAATFAVLRRLPIRPRLRAALEAESGFNDPPVIILATVVASEAWFSASPLGLGVNVAWQLVGGAVVGLVVALAGRWFLPRAALPTAGLYPLAVLSLALGAFAVAGLVSASGILAAYVAGLVLGNSRLPHRQATLSFTEGVAHLAQIVLFVMLGLLASPARLPGEVLTALLLGAVLTFVARPVAVVLCATPFRIPWREQVFISWAGLRGARADRGGDDPDGQQHPRLGADLRRGVPAGGDLHAGAGAVAAVGGAQGRRHRRAQRARDRRRLGAAGAGGRAADPGVAAAGLADARRLGAGGSGCPRRRWCRWCCATARPCGRRATPPCAAATTS